MRSLLLSVVLFLTASIVLADTVSVRPNGDTSFRVSVTGPTRLSVIGDRISKIIQSDSQFEMVNDENTGDVFLRFVGDRPEPESGHIITEAGHTIGFTLRPDRNLDTQTVLVRLTGVPTPEEQKADEQEEAADRFVVSEGASGSRASSLTRCVREVFERRIRDRVAHNHRALKDYNRGGCRARVLSVSGAQVRPQSFYNRKTRAIWVDDVVSGGRRWVVIVE